MCGQQAYPASGNEDLLTVSANPSPLSFLALFENCLRTRPESRILSHTNESITWQEFGGWIEDRETSLAAWRPIEKPLGGLPLLVDNSLTSYATVLTFLITETPFALLDSSAPPERLNAQLRLLGASKPLTAGSNELWGMSADQLEGDLWGDTIGGHSSAPISSDSAFQGVTIFSSGSTGTPKGILVPFSMLRDQLNIFRDEFTPGSQEVKISSLAPIHVSGAIKRLLRGLIGAEICIISPRDFTLVQLVEELRRTGITHLHLPSQIARLIAQSTSAKLPRLDDVVSLKIGSEPIRFETLNGLRKILRDEVIVSHGLSATEGNSGIRNRFPLGSVPSSGQVPLGIPSRPEDVHFEPVEGPDKEVFEVHVSGPIAHGYLGNPELTTNRFVTKTDGKRWWLSGDLVSKDINGAFVHQGRRDDLVKIRGILSSPADSILALMALEGIRNVAVVAESDEHGCRFVAHLEVDPDADLPNSEIRQSLLRVLPEHLVPIRFVRHDNLPTSPRGKIDRVKLVDFKDH